MVKSMAYIFEKEIVDKKTNEKRKVLNLVFNYRKGDPNQLQVGETVTLQIRGQPGNPKSWVEYPGTYSPSVQGFFRLQDGRDASGFIATTLRADKVDVTLVQALRSLSEGDIVTITRERRQVQKGKFAGKDFDLYVVEPVRTKNGIPALDKPKEATTGNVTGFAAAPATTTVAPKPAVADDAPISLDAEEVPALKLTSDQEAFLKAINTRGFTVSELPKMLVKGGKKGSIEIKFSPEQAELIADSPADYGLTNIRQA